MLVEHPWSSDMWKHPPMQKLLQSGQLALHRADMCAYGLSDPDNQLPVLKPTGLAVSHEDMHACVLTCAGHQVHHKIAGHTREGSSRSALAAIYTKHFVEIWLSCIRPQSRLCMFAELQDQWTGRVSESLGHQEVLAAAAELQDPTKVRNTLKKLHNNLGHPSTCTLQRILKNAGATEQAVKEAEQVENNCDVCLQRKRPTPSLPANPEKAVDFNQRVGWDVKNLPGWGVNQKVKCVNIVDFATSFQVMVPFYEKETGEVLRKAYLEAWQ